MQGRAGLRHAGTYVAGMQLEAAPKAIQDWFDDKPAFIRALHEARLAKSPIGPVRIDAFGQPVLNICAEPDVLRPWRARPAVPAGGRGQWLHAAGSAR